MFVDAVTFRRLIRARDLLAAEDATTVREVARRVSLSPFHFIRVFGALYGDTPHQFRTRLRIDRAKALLTRGASVTETCVEVGFSSVGSFSALFTRWNGAPPSAYRRSVAVPCSFSPIHVPGCLGMLSRLPSNSREALRA